MELQLFVSSSSQSASEEINQTGSAEIGPMMLLLLLFIKKYSMPLHCLCMQDPFNHHRPPPATLYPVMYCTYV
jgi:hypothetical protein